MNPLHQEFSLSNYMKKDNKIASRIIGFKKKGEEKRNHHQTPKGQTQGECPDSIICVAA